MDLGLDVYCSANRVNKRDIFFDGTKNIAKNAEIGQSLFGFFSDTNLAYKLPMKQNFGQIRQFAQLKI